MNRLLLLLSFLCICHRMNAQNPPPESFSGFQTINHEVHDEMPPEQREQMYKMLQENIAMLERQGITAESALRKTNVTTKFAWPLRQAAGFTDPGYYGISNFVDVDATKGNTKDFNCGTRTYDGHYGTDIFTVPFWWKKMDDNAVEVIAAADGIIIGKETSKQDRSCQMCPQGDRDCFAWNVVFLQHADGVISIYGHMKQNSVTTKAVGESVTKGEYLGVVGSSGNSSGPHLHFEVWENRDFKNLLLPWEGPCNPDGNASMWEEQQPYYNPQIIKVMSGSALPDVNNCYGSGPETTHQKSSFTVGESVYLTTFIRDHRGTGNDYLLALYGPSGQLIFNWRLRANTWAGHYSWLYFYYTWGQTVFKEPGNYRYTVKYGAQTEEVNFSFKSALPLNLLLFAGKASGDQILLNWATTAEENTSHFEVEHSVDGQQFNVIEIVSTTGNGRTADNYYSAHHHDPRQAANFYRLKMADRDGGFTYSDVVKVRMDGPADVKLFPNPASQAVVLSNVSGYDRVTITNASGRLMVSQSIKGTQQRIDVSSLLPGLYMVHMTGTGKQWRNKLLISR